MSYRGQRRYPRRQRDGTTAVEFAFVAPALFLVFFASIEFGRAVMLHHTVSHVVEDGARRAAVRKGSTVEEVRDWMEDQLVQRGIPRDAVVSIDIEAQPPGGGEYAAVTDLESVERGQKMRVSVAVSFKEASWLPPLLVPESANIESSTQTKRE